MKTFKLLLTLCGAAVVAAGCSGNGTGTETGNDTGTGDTKKENFGTRTESVIYKDGDVVVLAVDYTTNVFLGGYTVSTVALIDAMRDGTFRLNADYNEPCDFGNVTVYEAATETKLFAGDITWMGTGKQTYPTEMYAPGSFKYTTAGAVLPAPKPTMFHYDEYEKERVEQHPYDLKPVMAAIDRVGVAWEAMANYPGAPVYTMLYRRSVGMGNPAEWYWLIFIRG